MSELGKYQLPKGWAWATIPDVSGKAGVFIDGDWVESKDQDPDGDVRFNWGTRLNKMKEATRAEVEPMAEIAFNMRYVGKRFDEKDGKEWPVYGVFYVDDLRPKQEREADAEK